jgi:hypothetical protein
MRVIDLDTGDTLQAANDDDLAKVVARWAADNDQRMTDEQVEQLVARRAYDASDS